MLESVAQRLRCPAGSRRVGLCNWASYRYEFLGWISKACSEKPKTFDAGHGLLFILQVTL